MARRCISAEHAELARKAGVPKVIVCKNGDLVKLGPGEPGVIDQLPHGRLYKDGLLLETEKARAVAERRRMSFAGVVFVALAITEKGELADDPQVDMSGVPEKDADGKTDRRSRLRCRAVHLREPAARAAARPGCACRKHPPRGAQRGQCRLGQEAGLPGAGADGLATGVFR